MAAHMEETNKTRDRKLKKKLFQIKDRLTKKENIVICENPSPIVCVQNGGLDNGVSQDELLPLFSQWGRVDDIIMIPRKSYCFVCYTAAEGASLACDNLTGHLLRQGKDPSQNITLYVFFVEKAPPGVCPSTQMPPGLKLVEDFISVETEQNLLQLIQFDDNSSDCSGSSLKHRAVRHFGYEFKYGINNVDPNEPLDEGIPEECEEFLRRALDLRLVSYFPDQLTVNRYLPGQGIPSHVDTPSAFEDGIMSLSCGSQVIMDFRHPDGTHLSVLVPPRSLLVMSGDSRYVWAHGITPRKSDIVPSATGGLTLSPRGIRTSFTFRKLSPTAGVVTSEQKNSTMPTTDKEAADLEKEHVHAVYEEIAEHFSDTRHKPWPQIAEFLLAQAPGSVLVDIGCGNGKYFGVNPHLCQVGSDRSENLAAICRTRGFEMFVSDVLSIPVRSGFADVALCIAVIHHLSTHARRRKAVEELVRILRPGGCVLIYVWAQEQKKDDKKSKYLKPRRECKRELQTGDRSEQQQGSNLQEIELQNGDQCVSIDDSDQRCESEQFSDRKKKSECDGDGASGRTTVCHQHDDKMKPSGSDNSADLSDRYSTLTCESTSTKSSECSETGSSNSILQVHVNRTEFKEQDMLVPWQLKKGKSKSRVAEKGDGGGCEGQATGAKGQTTGAEGKMTGAESQTTGAEGQTTGAEGQTSSVEGQTSSGEGQTYHRYYHVFREGELDTLCAEVGGCVAKKMYYDQGNWCVVLQKL